ncbi:ABC transporter ATP-binding protein [Conexibacter sp. SYSU D00693]|uniref:ABC transporter transmembrane domain-containing protein n=1 Tax=Conexibacter sp. SYSU D00693 TaxID=2812560 RepID=UPI00196AE430|nr:ABC transporter ATP-binding protein [Conexibacter sp. SYSU D00693]
MLRSHRRGTALGASLLGAHQALEALVPVVVGAAIDGAVARGDAGALARWIVLLVVLFGFLSQAYRFGAIIAMRTAERAAHDLRQRLTARVVDPRGGGEGGRLPGELLSIATADVDAAAGIVRACAWGAGVVVALGAGAAVLLLTSPTLALVVLVGLPVVVWLGSRLAALLERHAAGQQEAAADAAGVATDLVEGLRVLQGIGGAPAGSARYREASRSSLRATLTAARAEAAFEGSAVLVSGIALAAVALVGGRMAAQGDLTLGELVAAVGITQFLVGPLQRMAAMTALAVRAQASADRLAEALAAAPAVGGPDAPAAAPSGSAALRLRAVRGRSLRGMDLDVAAGSTVALVVDARPAADELLDVLGREVELEGGSVEVGGVALAALDPAAARAAVLVAPHDGALLGRSVRDEVEALAGGDAEAVARAMDAAALDDVAAALPDGLDTALEDGGRALSGGQRQRVGLARVLAAPAPVLVLDEPTTALDAATEARVASALVGARGGGTTLLVTDSPALLAAADEVVVVRGGVVAARGTHAELLARDAGYREAVLR